MEALARWLAGQTALRLGRSSGPAAHKKGDNPACPKAGPVHRAGACRMQAGGGTRRGRKAGGRWGQAASKGIAGVVLAALAGADRPDRASGHRGGTG